MYESRSLSSASIDSGETLNRRPGLATLSGDTIFLLPSVFAAVRIIYLSAVTSCARTRADVGAPCFLNGEPARKFVTARGRQSRFAPCNSTRTDRKWRPGGGKGTALKRKSHLSLPTSSRNHRGHQDAGIACTKSPTANPAKALPNVIRPSIAPLPFKVRPDIFRRSYLIHRPMEPLANR
jgi:hypothetical protein